MLYDFIIHLCVHCDCGVLLLLCGVLCLCNVGDAARKQLTNEHYKALTSCARQRRRRRR